MVTRRPGCRIELGPTTTVTIWPLVKTPLDALGTSVTTDGYGFEQWAQVGRTIWWQTELIVTGGWV
jgi:hypothetical protein